MIKNPAFHNNTHVNDNHSELARTLDTLLHRYVNLIDSDNHGGWTLEDEQIVLKVQLALNQSGFSHARASVR